MARARSRGQLLASANLQPDTANVRLRANIRGITNNRVGYGLEITHCRGLIWKELEAYAENLH